MSQKIDSVTRQCRLVQHLEQKAVTHISIENLKGSVLVNSEPTAVAGDLAKTSARVQAVVIGKQAQTIDAVMECQVLDSGKQMRRDSPRPVLRPDAQIRNPEDRRGPAINRDDTVYQRHMSDQHAALVEKPTEMRKLLVMYGVVKELRKARVKETLKIAAPIRSDLEFGDRLKLEIVESAI